MTEENNQQLITTCASPPSSPTKRISGGLVNGLTVEQVKEMIGLLKGGKYIKQVKRGDQVFDKSLYKPVGSNKHGQVDVKPVLGTSTKVLVHHLYWRYQNDFALVPSDPRIHISHLDAEPEVMNLVAESRDMNESRKYCHKFKWYLQLPGEDRLRCPHWENPCTGPLE